MLLFCIARNKIILAEAVELPRVVLLLAALHLATLAPIIVAECSSVRMAVLAAACARIRIAIVLVYFCVGGTFTVHELSLIHSNMVLKQTKRESEKLWSKKSIRLLILILLRKWIRTMFSGSSMFYMCLNSSASRAVSILLIT